MTHDELLARIDNELTCYCGHPDLCDGVQSKEQAPSWYALRAVVELHKPMIWKNLGNDTDGYKCQECEGNSYPCPTIQAIEKELG
jgi:hypothetical protein